MEQIAALTQNFQSKSRLLLASFLGLYFELLIIRYLSAEIRILAYFTNVTLMSSILGLGLGMITNKLYHFRVHSFLSLLALLLTIVFIIHGGVIHLPNVDQDHFIWNGWSRYQNSSIFQYVFLFIFYVLNTMLFMPLGRLIANYFDLFGKLEAYTLNILGSLLGMIFLTWFSYLNIQPVALFIFGLLIYGYMLKDQFNSRDTGLLVGTIALILLLAPYDQTTIWSPYYKINVKDISISTPNKHDGKESKKNVGFTLFVNEDSHMQTLDLSGRYDYVPELKHRKFIYNLPYQYGSNDSVLIVGAGTGNDIAAALRAGAKHVDAVEIDPIILKLGKAHPERPYQDPRVTIHNTDARNFVQKTKKHYDKIVLGYLDSHTLFSTMNSVRLDNFVYTIEFFKTLKSHLKQDGVLSVTFTIHEQWIANRLYLLFKETFHQQPMIIQGAAKSSKGTVFIGGAGINNIKVAYSDHNPIFNQGDKHSWQYRDQVDYLNPEIFSDSKIFPSDDWPYLYLKEKTIPLSYLIPLTILLFLSLIMVRYAEGEKLKLANRFFFLGAAFLLVETKAITELSLYVGSTWITNPLVIGTILLLILAANYCAQFLKQHHIAKLYMVLIATILFPLCFPLAAYLSMGPFVSGLIVAFILCSPLFFSGLIFAYDLQHTDLGSKALGANLLGAMFGGILEYASLAYGFKVLYLVAIILYGVSYLAGKESIA
jgi:SAM-dependent methyltransferase